METGAACNAGSTKEYHVLLVLMGALQRQRDQSLGPLTTEPHDCQTDCRVCQVWLVMLDSLGSRLVQSLQHQQNAQLTFILHKLKQ